MFDYQDKYWDYEYDNKERLKAEEDLEDIYNELKMEDRRAELEEIFDELVERERKLGTLKYGDKWIEKLEAFENKKKEMLMVHAKGVGDKRTYAW